MKTAQLEVVYESHMGSDLMVVNAARQSFSKQKTVFEPEKDTGLIHYLATGKRTKEWDNFLDEVIELAQSAAEHPERRADLKKKLIAYKREAQHWAPFAHPHITLRLRMPIFLARQFVKHSVGSIWSEESRRYIDEDPEFYFEPVLMTRPDDIKQGAAGELTELDLEVVESAMCHATQVAASTYSEITKLYDLAPEQAREILTLNTMTGVTWTGSLAFWARVCNQRLDAHAQHAAQRLAQMIDEIIEPLFPVSWTALVK